MNEEKKWTEAEYAQLRADWAEGISTSAIGVRLGRSKNSVVGKAHRLGLPSRPSPINRGQGVPRAKVAKPLPKGASTLRPLRTFADEFRVDASVPAQRDVVAPKPVVVAFSLPLASPRGDGCSYIIEGERAGALRCDAARVWVRRGAQKVASSYCAAHARVCAPAVEIIELVAA